MKHDSVCRKTVTVNIENGLHLIPCSLIAQLARNFECGLAIKNGEKIADAKNVLDIIALGAVHGTKLELETHGEGATELIEKVVDLFESDFQNELQGNS